MYANRIILQISYKAFAILTDSPYTIRELFYVFGV